MNLIVFWVTNHHLERLKAQKGPCSIIRIKSAALHFPQKSSVKRQIIPSKSGHLHLVHKQPLGWDMDLQSLQKAMWKPAYS